jgi:GntR family transcriptional repressor for pyruvate dehydrogenase complex
MAAIESDLTAGRLKVGSRLPGERALAADLGVGRSSVREAIRVLEAMGVIRTSVGSGAEAGAIVIAEPAAGLAAALRLHLASSQLPVADIVETRVLLESWSARQNAAHGDAAGLSEATALLATMDGALSPDEFHAMDVQFHVLLAHATGNSLIAAMMSALRSSIASYVLDAVPALPNWANTARRLQRQHRAILAAITAGDGESASLLVSRHIEGFHRETTKARAKAQPR